ncbi:MAG: TIGR01777 family oxidoreductase [Anaerolineae bacterium]
MKVIITGGTGTIGRIVANSLSADKHEVFVLSRNKNKTAGLASGIQVVGWDATSASGWGHMADGAGAIINLAGESLAGEGFPPSRWTDERKRRIRESRVNAGKAVAEAVGMATNKPAVVIQSSAVGYYGVHGDESITEDSPAGNDFLASVCKDWEASTASVEALGVRRAVIRTGIVLSSKGGALPRLALPFRFFVGGPIGNGKQQMPWIHIDDEIAAIRYLMDTPSASGVFNLAAPEPVNNATMARALGRALGRPSFFPTPGIAFKIAFGELSTLLVDGQRAVPKHLLDAGFKFQFRDVEAALADIYKHGK